jgi:hypothetical protein
MGDELKAWIRLISAAGMICALISAIVVQTRILRHRWKSSRSLFSKNLFGWTNTKEDYLFAIFVVIVVVLGNVAVRLN